MWRNTALKAQLLPGVDGRVAIGLLIFLLHFSWITFGIFAGTCAFFRFISLRGYTLQTASLRARRLVTGDIRAKWSPSEFNRRSLPGDMPA